MDTPKTLREAILYFSDAENCRQFMIEIRWPNGVVRCPYCDSDAVTYLEKAKLYFCKGKHPKQKFSLKIKTIFEDSPIGLDKWLPAFWLLSNCKNGISSYEVARALGVTQKSAWFMMHRIRKALDSEPFLRMGGENGGPVEVDEAFFGPIPQKMHRERRLKMKAAEKGTLGTKAVVMGMLDRDLRQVRAQVVPNVKRETLQNRILDELQPNSTVYTDGWSSYDNLAAKNFVHETVNHIDEYVRGQVHTQGIENFWSLLKRGLRGTYIAVEPFHLDRYVTEQVFRYNNRSTKDNPLTDADRFYLAVSQSIGKRLTLAELTGKTEQRPN